MDLREILIKYVEENEQREKAVAEKKNRGHEEWCRINRQVALDHIGTHIRYFEDNFKHIAKNGGRDCCMGIDRIHELIMDELIAHFEKNNLHCSYNNGELKVSW